MDKRPKKDAVPNVTQAMMLIASMSASKRAAKRPRDDSEDLDTKDKTDHVAPDLQPEPDSAAGCASKQTTRRQASRGAGVKRTTGKGKAGIDKTPPDCNNSADAACAYIASVAPRLSSDEHNPKLSEEMLTCEHTADIKSPYAEPKGTFGGGMIFVGSYPATIMWGVLMTTMTMGMALNSCSTFKRMFIQMGIPLDFNLLVVDAIPFMHPTHSGHFTWRPDVAATAIVAMWFRERILRAIKRVACGGRIPVLYVVAQVWCIFLDWGLELEPVVGMGGLVYRTTIAGVAVLLVQGQHPSPRSWAGDGFKSMVLCLQAWKACLINPRDPTAGLSVLHQADMDNVEEMCGFFEKNHVSVIDITSLKRSCLHRIHSYVAASFNVILTASLPYAQRMTPLEMALLATQADDIPCTSDAISAFLKVMIAANLGSVVCQSLAVLQGIVRLSNAIASVTICGTLTGPSSVTGQVALLFKRLQIFPKPRWPNIIAALPATVILHDALPVALAALAASGIQEEHWAGLLSTNGAINAIAAGCLSVVLAALASSGIEKKHWASLLSTGGAINAIADGCLPAVLANLTKSGIAQVHWHLVLGRNGVINAFASDDAMRSVFAALTISCIPSNTWHVPFAQSGILGHIADDKLPLIVARMDRLGLHASGQGEIYSSPSFWEHISTVLLDKRFEVALSLLAHRDQHTRLEAMRSPPWHQEIGKEAVEAANQILLKKGNKVARFKDVVVSELQKFSMDAIKWSADKTVLDTFERSKMWDDWTAAGHSRVTLKNYIARLRLESTKEKT